jgi:hypothetical protein
MPGAADEDPIARAGIGHLVYPFPDGIDLFPEFPDFLPEQTP